MCRERRSGKPVRDRNGMNDMYPMLDITCTKEQAEAAQKRLREVTAYPALIGVIPAFRDAVDALPSLDMLQKLMVELRVPVLDALRDAGATIPFDTWAVLGVAWAYRP